MKPGVDLDMGDGDAWPGIREQISIAAQAVTYWNGEAMQTTDYQDLDHTPEKTAAATDLAAGNTVHLAQLLRGSDYPPTTG